ncbi:HEAT repeat domain-containing protein [Maribacter cobaltidurans]|uniref:Uncharacterized protein n=1 Tax=Maribacter cobaltidurans TaxID=1178778 RepID=A0A223V3A9_9FLAO|nr:HEAT repeat domain-containing protein [Maribacter cobaltidurans]ASV29895.1 hypothetical protein CJ263_06485 [Maribacter cobaltidurans]GGD88852.1 hypothetical protein GCM10011412_28450 [Maribacter cobaltidurans]
MDLYNELNTELKKHGIKDMEVFGEVLRPIDRLVNSKMSSKPYVDILIKYLDKLNGNEAEMVIRALTEKGNQKAVPTLINLFKREKGENLWIVGNALYVIDDKNSYTEILDICRNKSFGIARQMLMGTLARIKSDEAYDVLINCLSDASVKGHAIEGLGRFGNPEAIKILEKIDVEKGKYEYKAKNNAIRKLKRKQII